MCSLAFRLHPCRKMNPLSIHSELDSLCIVLVSTRNPLNIGAVARAMSNFGVRHLRVVNPYDPAFREAKSAVGASKVLADAHEFKSLAEAVADCHLIVGTTAAGHREFHHPLRHLEAGGRIIRQSIGSQKIGKKSIGKKSIDKKNSAPLRVALLFGSEKRGLSNDDFSHCHWLMRIPTHETNFSMNLGQAVAVCLYELARDTGAERPAAKQAPASSESLERITLLLADALCASGYLKPHPSALVMEKVRRQVRRLKLSAQDAELWLGILRQIVWKLRSEK